MQVLEALQYAHQKQVIHRDLKASNILVTEAGQVRLLDFGVAKLLEADEGDSAPLTSVYGRALTPDYASPELLHGELIDTRSDIYSLGILLYEMLTGLRPYNLRGAASIGALEQAIAAVEVKQAQRATGSGRKRCSQHDAGETGARIARVIWMPLCSKRWRSGRSIATKASRR